MSSFIPTREQREVLDIGLGTVRIRAGAGTGKTTTVAMVIANLVENHGVAPERTLGITFSNKAEYDLADRVREMLGAAVDEGRQAEVHTYHGFAAQILAEFGSLAGIDTRVRVITPTFSRQILSEIFHNSSYRHIDITYPGHIDKVRTLGDRLSDHLLIADELLRVINVQDDVGETRVEMLETLVKYQEEKVRLGVVDYGDLITMSAKLMDQFPDLARQVGDRYEAVVLDEYQDTNPAQRVLLTTIFGDGFPVIGVGDEDQTIYEWRGATPENFEMFTKHFHGVGGRPAVERGLTLNRRSAQSILDIANQIRKRANPGAEELVAADKSRSGQVTTCWASDAIAEADWIAEQFRRLHEGGSAWKDMAVLFRKNKDFSVVVEAMRLADIPVEVANIGGLLSVPEVAEVRAWLTILERPGDSSALTEILFGSRYRLGLADVAPLSARAPTGYGYDGEEPDAISLLEVIEQLDSVPGLRSRARDALNHFFSCYRALVTDTQGTTLVETCRLILDRTRAWRDIEALPDTVRLTARLNLYRLLDLAEDWSPLSGRPSVGAFLDYLDTMESEPAEELDAARLSGEDAVTLVTIHRAKGLEWDIVALPAVTKGNFPNTGGQLPDPVRFAEYLPPAHRIDQTLRDLPEDEEGRKALFRHQNERQEWRIAYVAATRSKTRLLISGAHWYGLPEPNQTPKKPSELFELVADQEGVIDAGRAPLGPRPDLLIRDQTSPNPDPLFEDGWATAIRDAAGGGSSLANLAGGLGISNAVDERAEELTGTLFSLDDRVPSDAAERVRAASVTGLVTYAGCPKQFYWTAVDPLPRRHRAAAIAGTELHRRIELFQRGQIPLELFDLELYDAPGEADGVGGWTAFEQSRFAATRPGLVEAPFVVELDNGYRVRGRIDAVYIEDDHWEIVDFKSGRPRTEPARMVQLEAYAVAARDADFGVPAPAAISVTFAYLGGGLQEDTWEVDAGWMDDAEQRLLDITGAIDRQEFPEVPGDRCSSCDFLRFCEPGRNWVATQ